MMNEEHSKRKVGERKSATNYEKNRIFGENVRLATLVTGVQDGEGGEKKGSYLLSILAGGPRGARGRRSGKVLGEERHFLYR